jgi:hypothetical protein
VATCTLAAKGRKPLSRISSDKLKYRYDFEKQSFLDMNVCISKLLP